MCLIIDTCCLANVFDSANQRHADFVPVWQWLFKRNGCMIYGGTKYNRELMSVAKIFGMLTELEKKHKLVMIDAATVDAIAGALKTKVPCAAFNDEHIVALVIASRCRVVCTDDTKAIPYLKRSDMYHEYNLQPPKIYRRKRDHARLCCRDNVVPICR